MSKRASTSAKIRQLLQPSTGRKEGTWTKELQAKVQGSLDVLRRMLLEYGPGLGLSFNGGKDCTLLLYLLCVVLEESPLREEPFPTVYVTHHAPFPEVNAFVNDTVRDYGLDMHRVHEPMKAGLNTYLEEVPRVKAILVGTRHGDPYSSGLSPL
jgi:FAD synthetase